MKGPGTDGAGAGVRALVVDDHPLGRAGMLRTLEDMAEIGAVDEAATGEAALAALAGGDHALVLLDLALPGLSGVEVARRTIERGAGTRVIVVTGDGAAPVGPLVAAGVAGWLTKGAEVAEIEAAVRTALAGGRHLEREVAQRLALEGLGGAGASPFERLTPRELEICRLVNAGVPGRRIAERLHISEKTVSTHRTRAFEKLGIDSVQALVRLALRQGLWGDDGDGPA